MSPRQTQQRFQLSPDFLDAAKDVLFGCARADAQDRADLLDGLTLKMSEDERRAFARTQAAQCRLHSLL